MYLPAAATSLLRCRAAKCLKSHEGSASSPVLPSTKTGVILILYPQDKNSFLKILSELSSFHVLSPCYNYLCTRSNPLGDFFFFFKKRKVEHLKSYKVGFLAYIIFIPLKCGLQNWDQYLSSSLKTAIWSSKHVAFLYWTALSVHFMTQAFSSPRHCAKNSCCYFDSFSVPSVWPVSVVPNRTCYIFCIRYVPGSQKYFLFACLLFKVIILPRKPGNTHILSFL